MNSSEKKKFIVQTNLLNEKLNIYLQYNKAPV